MGVPPATVQRILRHSSITVTTGTYVEVIEAVQTRWTRWARCSHTWATIRNDNCRQNCRQTALSSLVRSEFSLVGLSGHNSKRSQALMRLLEGDPRQLFPDDAPFQAAKPFHTQRHLTDAEQADLITKYQAGSDMQQLAKEFGLHRRTARAILDRHGIERRQYVLTASQIDEAVRLYQRGASLAEVGRRFGVEHSTIRKHLIARGIARRDTHGHER
jgi:lambda repressor-like predicted transcriptional regulator